MEEAVFISEIVSGYHRTKCIRSCEHHQFLVPDTLIRSGVTINLIFYICEQNLYQQINNANKMPGGLERLNNEVLKMKHTITT